MSCPLVQKTPLTCLLTLCLLTKHFILAPAAATTVHHICRVPHTRGAQNCVLIYSACGAKNFSVLIYSHVEPIHPYTGCSENKRHLCALTSTTSPQHLLLPAVKTVHVEAHLPLGGVHGRNNLYYSGISPPPAVGLMISTPIASKVHCSINGLEKSSSIAELEY